MNKYQVAKEIRDVISGTDRCTHITVGKVGRSWKCLKDLNFTSAPKNWSDVQSFRHSCNHATVESVLQCLLA